MLKKILYFFTFITLLSCNLKKDSELADMVILNAKIYTLSWDDPSVEGKPADNAPLEKDMWKFDATAIAIKNGKIQLVGTEEQVAKFIGSTTQKIDAKGAVVIPGLIESHGHLHELGEKKEAINLNDLDEDEILERIVERAKNVPKGEWIIASGWDEAVFANGYPDMRQLSDRTPDHPVVLIGLRGFGAMGNSLAFEKAGITKETQAKDGGEILKDSRGNLTYVLLNSAKKLLLDKVPQKSLEQQTRIMNYGFEELLSLGFTTTHHLGVDKNHMEVYEHLSKNDSLPMRVHAFIAARMYNIDLVNEWLEKGPTTDPESFLHVKNFKAYYDGSLGSRGAEFLEDYSDQKGHRGVGGEAYGFYEDLIKKAMDKGFQMGIHAIGDKANRDVLNIFENYFEKNPSSKELRHRIEHAQVVHPDDFSRFAELNIIASMEPAHAVEDMPWAMGRVGNNPSFFYGMYSAITKKKLGQEKAYFPEQAFTKEETLRAYTIWGAYAAHQEKLTGSIEVGKWADLTFINVDVLNASAEEILEGQILKTIINGRVAFEK